MTGPVEPLQRDPGQQKAEVRPEKEERAAPERVLAAAHVEVWGNEGRGSFYFIIVLLMFIFDRGREGQRERERERERIQNRLHAVSTKPGMGLELTNLEIMT